MKRWEAWINHLGIAGVALSGLAYAIMKYMLTNPDPDSRLGHPWQPWAVRVHILLAPVAVFGLGLIFRRHALARFFGGDREGRRSGRVLLFLAVPLGISGYLIEAITHESVRRWTGWTHTAAGLLFAAAYAFHPRRSRLPENSAESPSHAQGQAL